MALAACGRTVVAHHLDDEIGRALGKALCMEYGTQPVEDDWELPLAEFYAPMRRLLSREDEVTLVRNLAGDKVGDFRRERRALFLNYLRRLWLDCLTMRKARITAMEAAGEWDMMDLIAHKIWTQSTFCTLRWFVFKHWLGFQVDTQDVDDLVSWVLCVPQRRPEAS